MTWDATFAFTLADTYMYRHIHPELNLQERWSGGTMWTLIGIAETYEDYSVGKTENSSILTTLFRFDDS